MCQLGIHTVFIYIGHYSKWKLDTGWRMKALVVGFLGLVGWAQGQDLNGFDVEAFLRDNRIVDTKEVVCFQLKFPTSTQIIINWEIICTELKVDCTTYRSWAMDYFQDACELSQALSKRAVVDTVPANVIAEDRQYAILSDCAYKVQSSTRQECLAQTDYVGKCIESIPRRSL
jgi:hypothetical protein